MGVGERCDLGEPGFQFRAGGRGRTGEVEDEKGFAGHIVEVPGDSILG